MKCIVELFGDDRNGRKMIAWGRRIGCADAGYVFAAERRPRFHSPRRFAILVSAMLGQSFTEFIFATNTDGSGKAASYVRALDMLGPILAKHYPKPIVGGSVWHGFSIADIHAFSRSGTRQLRAVTFMKGQASKEQMTWVVLRVDLRGNYYSLELGKRIA